MGGVWDDSGSALQHSGGDCITEAQAQQRYDAAAGAIQMEVVQLSHDGGLAGFGELGAHSTIRQADKLSANELYVLRVPSAAQVHTEAQAQHRYDAAGGAIDVNALQLSHDGPLLIVGDERAQHHQASLQVSHLVLNCRFVGSPQWRVGHHRGAGPATL